MPLYTVLYDAEAIATALSLAELAAAGVEETPLRDDDARVVLGSGEQIPEPQPARFEVYGEKEANGPEEAMADVAALLALKLPEGLDVKADVPMLAYASRYGNEATAVIESTRVARASLAPKEPAA